MVMIVTLAVCRAKEIFLGDIQTGCASVPQERHSGARQASLKGPEMCHPSKEAWLFHAQKLFLGEGTFNI